MSNLKTLLNFTRQGAGGGVQNALSFLTTLATIDDTDNYIVFVRKSSPIAAAAKASRFTCRELTSRDRFLIDFSTRCRREFTCGQVCFTFFGPPWIASKGYLLNVCGVAYSNLYYPEIEFWKHYKGICRLRRELTDRLRLWSLSRADYWIFETEVLAQRALQYAKYPEKRVGVVSMTASSLVSPENVQPDSASIFNHRIPAGFRFLFLAGPAPNKQIHTLAAIAKELRTLTDLRFIVVTTLAEDSPYYKIVAKAFSHYRTEECWYNIGPCPYDKVASLIDSCQAMCTFSILESFSNNFVEAWIMNKPLLVCDTDWGRASAGDAAIYVEPNNPAKAARAMLRIMNDNQFYAHVTKQGTIRLSQYPTAIEKCKDYLDQINNARRLGILPREYRKTIQKWRCR